MSTPPTATTPRKDCRHRRSAAAASTTRSTSPDPTAGRSRSTPRTPAASRSDRAVGRGQPAVMGARWRVGGLHPPYSYALRSPHELVDTAVLGEAGVDVAVRVDAD